MTATYGMLMSCVFEDHLCIMNFLTTLIYSMNQSDGHGLVESNLISDTDTSFTDRGATIQSQHLASGRITRGNKIQMSMEYDLQQAVVMIRKSSTPVDVADCSPTTMTCKGNQIPASDTLSTQNRKQRPNRRRYGPASYSTGPSLYRLQKEKTQSLITSPNNGLVSLPYETRSKKQHRLLHAPAALSGSYACPITTIHTRDLAQDVLDQRRKHTPFLRLLHIDQLQSAMVTSGNVPESSLQDIKRRLRSLLPPTLRGPPQDTLDHSHLHSLAQDTLDQKTVSAHTKQMARLVILGPQFVQPMCRPERASERATFTTGAIDQFLSSQSSATLLHHCLEKQETLSHRIAAIQSDEHHRSLLP
ncbi:hypothetical protein M436DRAFT_66397 [Aureobasidium namibiae CBS 147.97]|uniref:Uncharacterized protein n=1 Tax=Aureobasidium namibiae CBS 147.97 TaxID=1043004 RepID=A0A074WBK1_9PEZI|nr:uncharacterized protein M436DRAFT_66397 [Aureobasidium namibiae CBS 147.97]KEQ70490.1 hypothetical protein M436DRAFT_66397 [Aureobasidium namibiae CBS 147.97]